MILRPPRSTPLYSSAASDVYKRQTSYCASPYRASLTYFATFSLFTKSCNTAVAAGRGNPPFLAWHAVAPRDAAEVAGDQRVFERQKPGRGLEPRAMVETSQ